MKDYGLREVAEDDVVMDARGKLYHILHTDPTISLSGVAYAQELRIRSGKPFALEPRTMIRVNHAFRLDDKEQERVFNWQMEDRARFYQQLYRELASERVRKELLERKQDNDLSLRAKGRRNY